MKTYAIDIRQPTAHSTRTGHVVQDAEWQRAVVTIQANRHSTAIKQAERLFVGKQVAARQIGGQFTPLTFQ